MTITKIEAARRLLKLKKAQDSFVEFVKLMNPEFTFADFQIELMEKLDALEKGTLGKQRLLITMPPRHAKSFSLLCIFQSIIYHVNRIATYSLPRTIRTWRRLLVVKYAIWHANLLLAKHFLTLQCRRKAER